MFMYKKRILKYTAIFLLCIMLTDYQINTRRPNDSNHNQYGDITNQGQQNLNTKKNDAQENLYNRKIRAVSENNETSTITDDETTPVTSSIITDDETTPVTTSTTSETSTITDDETTPVTTSTSSETSTTTEDETTSVTSSTTSETSTTTEDETTPVTPSTTSETSTTTEDETTSVTSSTTSETSTGTKKTTTFLPATCQDYKCAQNSYCIHESDGKPECLCNPGFYPTTDGCVESSQFGGTFFITTIQGWSRREARDTSEDDENTRNFVKSFVYEANNGTEGFIDVYVDEDPIINLEQEEEWNYKTIFDRTAGVTSDVVQNNMEEFVDETCDDTGCKIDGEVRKVDTTKTITNAIGNDAAACMGNTCDSRSTNCTVSEYGTISCLCKSDDFKQIPGSLIYCEATLCTSNSQCNYPFGECLVGVNNGIGMCQCMTTFSGENCENPWFFVFVVSVPLMIMIVLIVVAIHIIKKKRRKVIKEDEEKKKIQVKEVPALTFPAYPSLRARFDKHLDPGSQNENDSINLETFHMFDEKAPDRLPKHSTHDDSIEGKARNDNLPSQRTNQKERKSSNYREYQNPSYF